jgi:hypothetical protein
LVQKFHHNMIGRDHLEVLDVDGKILSLIKLILDERDADWIHLAKGRSPVAGSCEFGNEFSSCIKRRPFSWITTISFR